MPLIGGEVNYRIGVTIRMANHASAVLGVIHRDVLGLHRQVNLLTGGWNNARLAVVGFGAALAGGAVLGTMAKLVNHGKDFVHQQELMRQASISQMEITKAAGAAWNMATTIRGTTATGNLELIADLKNIFGTVDDALKVAGTMAKMQAVIGNVTGKDPGKSGYEFARFLELRGALVDPKTHEISTERLEQQGRMGQAIIVAMRGRVDPRQLFNFQKQARAAGMLLSDEGMLGAVPLIQAMGGDRAGTATAAITQQLVGGVMTQRTAAWLTSMGLLPADATKVLRGGHVRIDTKRLAGADLLSTDHKGWVETVLMPTLGKKGLLTGDDMVKALAKSGMRLTASGGLAEYVRNMPAFNKDIENIKRAATGDPYSIMFGGKDGKGPVDPTAAIPAFTSAWENLITALGIPLVEPATRLLIGMTDAMNGITQWAIANPDLTQFIGLTATGLGALSVALGAFAVGTAAAGALGLLTGPVGLAALAIGIEAFGRSMSTVPKWIIDIAVGAAAGGAVGLRFGGPTGGYLGALLGGGTAAATGGANAAAGVLPNLNDRLTNPNEHSYFARRFGKKPPEPVPVPSGPQTGPGGLLGRISYDAGGGGGEGGAVVIRGDVYLDGAKVGRWMSGWMAGQAGRAASGPSGVDLRMTPLQPGFATT